MASDLLWSNQVFSVRFGEITLEVCIPSHVRQVGASLRVSEKRFGEENNKLYVDRK